MLGEPSEVLSAAIAIDWHISVLRETPLPIAAAEVGYRLQAPRPPVMGKP